MDPAQAKQLVEDYLADSEHGAARRRWTDDWKTFTADVGQSPLSSSPEMAALWLADAALRRRVGDRPALSAGVLRQAAAVLDLYLVAHGLDPVAHTRPVRDVIDGALRARTPRPASDPLTPAIARRVLAAPPPAPPAPTRRTRAVVLDAAERRSSVDEAADRLRHEHGWPNDVRNNTIATLRRAALGVTGPGLLTDPGALDDEVLRRALLWLDPAAVAHRRTITGLAVGLHLALVVRHLQDAVRGQAVIEDDRLGLEVDGSTVWARTARDPNLCAVRHLQDWLAVLGPGADTEPLLPVVRIAGPLDRPPSHPTWQHGITALGMTCGAELASKSMRSGYVVTAYAQGAPIEQIAAGLRVRTLGALTELLLRHQHHLTLSGAPAPRDGGPK